MIPNSAMFSDLSITKLTPLRHNENKGNLTYILT